LAVYCSLAYEFVSSAMQIQQKSFATFHLKFKGAEVVINPTAAVKDAIVVYSLKDSPYLKYVSSETDLIVDSAGEYESKDVFVNGDKVLGEDVFVYTIACEAVTVGVISFVTNPTSIPVDFFETSDIILLGAGGGMNLSPKDAHELIQKLSPKIAILYGFSEQASKDVQTALLPIDEVKKEISAMLPTEKTYKIAAEDLDRIENTEIYYLDI
jgi:hypothetical protein